MKPRERNSGGIRIWWPMLVVVAAAEVVVAKKHSRQKTTIPMLRMR